MSCSSSNQPARRFAVEVVQRLRDAGYESLWAGGCVRDQLLNLTPSDYDVATSATPDQIRLLFGQRRTLPIGAAFGVITVLGNRSQGQVEVATFRCDATYSDGRHPDHVTFSTAREDAARRDFTINGLFMDPLSDQVIDFVGGQEDLKQGIVRAIGDPFQRIAEDRLRMLRAARFTATFEFQLEPATLDAIRQEAAQIQVVSAERIATEMRRMLIHRNRHIAVRLLREMKLLTILLPESDILSSTGRDPAPGMATQAADSWPETLAILRSLQSPTFRVALAGLLWNIVRHHSGDLRIANRACRRWKLSNQETNGTAWLLSNEPAVRQATTLPWPELQRVLISNNIEELLQLSVAIADATGQDSSAIDFCRSKLRLPPEQLDPAPLINGNDLRHAGVARGPIFSRILSQVRTAQLEESITTRQQALEFAHSIWGDAEPS